MVCYVPCQDTGTRSSQIISTSAIHGDPDKVRFAKPEPVPSAQRHAGSSEIEIEIWGIRNAGAKARVTQYAQRYAHHLMTGNARVTRVFVLQGPRPPVVCCRQEVSIISRAFLARLIAPHFLKGLLAFFWQEQSPSKLHGVPTPDSDIGFKMVFGTELPLRSLV